MPGMRVVERLGVLMPLRIAVCGSESFIIEASDHTTPASDGPWPMPIYPGYLI
jgi:hypothetical protein